jgi:hypothetical protein
MLYQLSHVRAPPACDAKRCAGSGVRFRTLADPARPANSHTRIGRVRLPALRATIGQIRSQLAHPAPPLR